MKCKVKKIPKYAEGTPFYKNADLYSQAGNFITQQIDNVQQSKQGVTAGGVVKGMAGGAATGAAIGSIVPGIGTAVGAIVGGAIGGITSGWGGDAKVNYDTNSINYSDIYTGKSGIAGLWHSDEDEKRAARNVQNANVSKIASGHVYNEYYNQPNIPVQPMVNAAEGGVMRKPVDALVSKGELIYNPVTKKLSQVSGSKGKPNKADDVYARLYEGDVVISNSDTMLMANGKTPAQNLMGMVDKYATGGTVKAREAIIKKVVNWQEANKTKPQEYAKFSEGEDEVLNVPIKPIKKNFEFVNYDPVAEMKKELDTMTFTPIKAEITGNDPLKNATNDQRIALRKAINEINGKKKGNWLSTLSDYVPLASALLKKPSYHKEQAYINPVKYVPTGVSIDPIRRATDEGMAIARYNQMNVNPSTGAGMAAGLQAAVNRSKSIADAYKWQQDAQNKLIAQNVGIYNEWAAREAQARHTANTETQQNEAAAMMMRDQAIKDAYEFQTGRRNDRWKLSMLEPIV